MKKHFIPPYFLTFIPISIIIVSFISYEIFRLGILTGIFIVLLTWSEYILCVPAAHGRLLAGAPARVFFNHPIFPEPFFWCSAVFLNALTILIDPNIYLKSIPTNLLLRIFTTPSYWPIFVIGTIGTWYRVFAGEEHYRAHESIHTLIRHIILIIGLGFFFYLIYADMFILLNVYATG